MRSSDPFDKLSDERSEARYEDDPAPDSLEALREARYEAAGGDFSPSERDA